MTAVELAYAAGFFDGEGTVGIYASRSNGGKTPCHQLTVAVCNTDRAVIDWFNVNFLGFVHVMKRYQEHHKQAYSWALTGRKAAEFLRVLLPYLTVKKSQALVAIEFVDGWHSGFSESLSGKKGRGRLPRSEFIRRELCRARLLELR